MVDEPQGVLPHRARDRPHLNDPLSRRVRCQSPQPTALTPAFPELSPLSSAHHHLDQMGRYQNLVAALALVAAGSILARQVRKEPAQHSAESSIRAAPIQARIDWQATLLSLELTTLNCRQRLETSRGKPRRSKASRVPARPVSSRSNLFLNALDQGLLDDLTQLDFARADKGRQSKIAGIDLQQAERICPCKIAGQTGFD